jgi:hypothetical protein
MLKHVDHDLGIDALLDPDVPPRLQTSEHKADLLHTLHGIEELLLFAIGLRITSLVPGSVVVVDPNQIAVVARQCKRRGKVKAVKRRRKMKAPCKLSLVSGFVWRWQVSSRRRRREGAYGHAMVDAHTGADGAGGYQQAAVVP